MTHKDNQPPRWLAAVATTTMAVTFRKVNPFDLWVRCKSWLAVWRPRQDLVVARASGDINSAPPSIVCRSGSRWRSSQTTTRSSTSRRHAER